MRVVPVESKQLQPRPPVASATPTSAGTTRPTVRTRPLIRPKLLTNAPTRRAPSDPYVRKFWTAALGPGAVADLLRLIRSAGLGESLPRPHHLADLVRVGLVARTGSQVWVLPTVPDLPDSYVRRLPPFLRREHRSWIERENRASLLS